MKTLVACIDDYVVEYPNTTFQEVLKAAPFGAVIALDVYKDDGIGWTFNQRIVIGNTADNLTMDDYYAAYDKGVL